MSRKEFHLILEASEHIAPDVKHFTFLLEEGGGFEFIPGQFITLHIPTPEKVLRRSYSIANKTHQATNKIEFAASYVPAGIASELLFTLKPGDKVTATGPFGGLFCVKRCRSVMCWLPPALALHPIGRCWLS